MEYEHPLYNPASVAAQRRLPAIERRAARVRRGLPRLGLPRGRRPLRGWPRPSTWGCRGDGRAGASGRERSATARRRLRGPRSATPGAAVPAHVRAPPRTPGWSTSTTCPTTGVAGRFEARDHLGDPTARSARTSRRSWPTTASSWRGGRILMAAHARAFGYCFNPISVFWCLDDRAAGGHGRRGAQHLRRPARLPGPPRRAGPGQVPKAMYVSPFHGTDGTYDLAVPVPGDRLHIAVTLRTRRRRRLQRVAHRHAHRRDPRCPPQAWRAAPAALRGSRSSAPTASGCGPADCRCNPGRPTTRKA